MSASVVLALAAEEALLSIRSRSDATAVASRLRALETFPRMGAAYDPEYAAARPDHDVFVTYADHMGIYYTYEAAGGSEDGSTVCVEWIRDERAGPEPPFA